MEGKKVVLFVVGIVILVALGTWLGFALQGEKPDGASPFSAVYLTTGDIYFGRLSWFPWPHMSDVWYLQRGVNQQNQPQLGIAPFSSVFWGPVSTVYLNPKEILLYTSLRNDSQLAKALANPAAIQPVNPAQQQAPAPQQQPQSATSTKGK